MFDAFLEAFYVGVEAGAAYGRCATSPYGTDGALAAPSGRLSGYSINISHNDGSMMSQCLCTFSSTKMPITTIMMSKLIVIVMLCWSVCVIFTVSIPICLRICIKVYVWVMLISGSPLAYRKAVCVFFPCMPMPLHIIPVPLQMGHLASSS